MIVPAGHGEILSDIQSDIRLRAEHFDDHLSFQDLDGGIQIRWDVIFQVETGKIRDEGDDDILIFVRQFGFDLLHARSPIAEIRQERQQPRRIGEGTPRRFRREKIDTRIDLSLIESAVHRTPDVESKFDVIVTVFLQFALDAMGVLN